MLDTTELLNGWIGKRVIAYALAPGGPPTSSAPGGESGSIRIAPAGVGTTGGVLKGFDDRGIIVDSGSPTANIEELHCIPWSAILDLKLWR